MLTRIIYFVLLLFMTYVLYLSGRKMQKRYVILSRTGVFAILAYTLNEGLRFGRGIDYNAYWKLYELMENGIESNTDNIGFDLFEKTLIFLNVPWQGCAMLMSFMFIFGILVFLKNYKEAVPIALPLWALLFHNIANNLMRWNLAFSFILIGLYYLIRNERKANIYFFFFSMIGCTIHYAITPIPFLFWGLYRRNRPLMHPFWSISIFVSVSIMFQSEFMLHFVEIFNFLSTFSSTFSDRFAHHGDYAEYWLTKSSGVNINSGWIGPTDTFLGCFITIVGYKQMRKATTRYVFAYNLFLIGFLFRPAAIQIELLDRYNYLFMYFKTVMFAYIVYLYRRRFLFGQKHKLIPVMISFAFLLCFMSGFKEVFKEREFKLWYIWDKGNKTPEKVSDLYEEDNLKK